MSTSTLVCHACQRTVHSSTGAIVCPGCDSEFVEIKYTPDSTTQESVPPAPSAAAPAPPRATVEFFFSAPATAMNLAANFSSPHGMLDWAYMDMVGQVLSRMLESRETRVMATAQHVLEALPRRKVGACKPCEAVPGSAGLPAETPARPPAVQDSAVQDSAVQPTGTSAGPSNGVQCRASNRDLSKAPQQGPAQGPPIGTPVWPSGTGAEPCLEGCTIGASAKASGEDASTGGVGMSGNGDACVAGSQCAVCHDHFQVGGTAVEMPCRHYYHEECIMPWLKEHNTCPICRHKLELEPAPPGSHGPSLMQHLNQALAQHLASWPPVQLGQQQAAPTGEAPLPGPHLRPMAMGRPRGAGIPMAPTFILARGQAMMAPNLTPFFQSRAGAMVDRMEGGPTPHASSAQGRPHLSQPLHFSRIQDAVRQHSARLQEVRQQHSAQLQEVRQQQSAQLQEVRQQHSDWLQEGRQQQASVNSAGPTLAPAVSTTMHSARTLDTPPSLSVMPTRQAAWSSSGGGGSSHAAAAALPTPPTRSVAKRGRPQSTTAAINASVSAAAAAAVPAPNACFVNVDATLQRVVGRPHLLPFGGLDAAALTPCPARRPSRARRLALTDDAPSSAARAAAQGRGPEQRSNP